MYSVTFRAFSEVGLNRQVDDLTLRVSHQASHADELTDLGDVTSGAGECHHVHRVEAVEVVDDFLRQHGRLWQTRCRLLCCSVLLL